MATINRTSGSEKQNFKQIEGDGWSGIYLPAICAGVVMTIVLFMAVSCSKKSDNQAAKISAPASPATQEPAPTNATAMIPEIPKKKIVKRYRPTTATYVNSAYGVSFTFPRKYSLQASAKDAMPVQAGFMKPGAVEIASVDMPDSGYPDTDFSSALLNVSVNQGLTAEECGQFAPTSKDAATPASTDDSAKADDSANATSKTDAAEPTAVKLGRNEFSEVEQMKEAGESQSDLKYFHLFKNGACYEFALDVETFRKGDEDLAQVDRGQVFNRLEKILTTARIKDVQLPGMENAGKTVVPDTTTAPVVKTQPVAPTTQTETTQVVTPEKPEQK